MSEYYHLRIDHHLLCLHKFMCFDKKIIVRENIINNYVLIFSIVNIQKFKILAYIAKSPIFISHMAQSYILNIFNS